MTIYSEYFTQIDELVGQHEKSVATFYHKNIQVPRGTAAANGFGTGFSLEHPKGIVIVTAEHVAREAMREKIVYLRLGNNMLSLEKQPFMVERSADLAMSLFTFEQLAEEGVEVVSPLKFTEVAESAIRTETYVVIGCPSSRNKLDQRFKRKGHAVHSMTLESAKIEQFDGTQIPVPLLLHYEPDEMVLGMNMPPNGRPFDLHGMSGGPIFDIFGEVEHGGEADPRLKLSLSLAGMAAEWHPDERLVVGVRRELIQYMMGHL